MAEIGRLLSVAKGSSLELIQSVDATEWRIGALHDLRATDYKEGDLSFMTQRVMTFVLTSGFVRMRLYGEAPRAYHVGPVLDSNVKAINAPTPS